jgi:hypothetical protein
VPDEIAQYARDDQQEKMLTFQREMETQRLKIADLEAAIQTLRGKQDLRPVPPEYQAGTPAFKDAILGLIKILNPADHPGMDGVINRAQKWKRTSFIKDVLDIIAIYMRQGGYL